MCNTLEKNEESSCKRFWGPQGNIWEVESYEYNHLNSVNGSDTYYNFCFDKMSFHNDFEHCPHYKHCVSIGNHMGESAILEKIAQQQAH